MPIRSVLTLATLLCAAGCATRTVTVSRTVEAVRGDAGSASGVGAAEFVPAVPAIEGVGRCSRMRVGGGELVVMRLAGAGGVERSVSLRFDSAGSLAGYSDVRGDLRPNGAGARTVVTIGFDNDSGTALNENPSGGATRGLVVARAAELLDLPSLGVPRRMMETVRRRCARGR